MPDGNLQRGAGRAQSKFWYHLWKREYEAQHSDPWGLVWLIAGDKAADGGHNVTLVCRQKTAELINRDGTEVRIKLRDEAVHRAIFSRGLPGTLGAVKAPNALRDTPAWAC
jgi:hypothetical protein